ncbi:MAG: glycosyltransferase family 2 protein [Patescibacteria group bacterium]
MPANKEKLSSLSVFFPVYNEEANLPTLIGGASEFIPHVAHKYELIIVNDGSCDGSLRVARKLQARYPHLRVISHDKNRGYGAALRSGINAAKYDWTFFTDSDLQFDIKQLATFIPHTKKHQIIIGYRVNRAEGALRSVNARLFKLYVDLLFRLHVRDIDCAFKLMKTKVIQKVELESSGAFTTSELLYKLKKLGLRFQQLPVDHYKRKFGQPTGASPKVIIKAVWDAFFLYVRIKLKSLFFGQARTESFRTERTSAKRS